MSQINRETLDYLYVKLPHKNDWKKYYVRYQNSQLLFYNSVKKHDFKFCYIIYKALVRRSKVSIGSSNNDIMEGNDENPLEKPRKIDALLISHKYDDEPLYITIPEIFEIHSIAISTGSQ
jgi:hypothetical protein